MLLAWSAAVNAAALRFTHVCTPPWVSLTQCPPSRCHGHEKSERRNFHSSTPKWQRCEIAHARTQPCFSLAIIGCNQPVVCALPPPSGLECAASVTDCLNTTAKPSNNLKAASSEFLLNNCKIERYLAFFKAFLCAWIFFLVAPMAYLILHSFVCYKTFNLYALCPNASAISSSFLTWLYF